MKILILLLVIVATFSSCHYVEVYDKNKQERETTVEILKLAEKDSILYKKVIIGKEMYFINTKTNLVEVSSKKDANPFVTFIIFLIIFSIIFIFGLAIVLRD